MKKKIPGEQAKVTEKNVCIMTEHNRGNSRNSSIYIHYVLT